LLQLTPLLILAGSLLLVPLAIIVWVSLTRRDSFFFEPAYTFANYLNFGDRYRGLLLRSVTLAGAATLVNVVVGVPFTYLLERRVRYRNLIRPMLIFPLFGGLYLAYGMRTLLLSGGLLDPALKLFGLGATDVLYTRGAVIFALALYTFPFMALNVGAALQRVEPNLEEAATALGAGLARRWARVILPLLRPGILTGALICFSLGLGEFAIPTLVGGPAQQGLLSIVIAERTLRVQDYGLASALGMVLVLLAFLVTYSATRASRESYRLKA
jgi:ABC-type spermidine/putrescine transport system permease subunit I